MPEPAARQRLREAREQAAAEREAREAQRPSMLREAVDAAAGVLPDAPAVTVEQVTLAVLRVALPLHETQHADAWKAAHERAVHFELEAMKCADLNRDLANENADMSVELERLRAQVAAFGEIETEWSVRWREDGSVSTKHHTETEARKRGAANPRTMATVSRPVGEWREVGGVGA